MLKVLLNFELIKCYISSVLCPAELTYGMLFHNDGTVTKAGPAPGVGTPWFRQCRARARRSQAMAISVTDLLLFLCR